MIKIAAVTLTLVAASSLTAQDAAHGQWIADFDVAVAAAKKANKDLLVDFTGSDWCGWCVRLHKEVFDHAEFNEGVDEHFVLVALDFPRGADAKAKVPNPERNTELQAKYAVRGFPTILLMTAEGEVYGRTGYQAGGPAKYVESLAKMRTEGKRSLAEINDLVAKFEAAKDVTRVEVMKLAIDKLATMASDQVGIDKIAAIAMEGVASDDTALQEKALTALLKSSQADAACMAKAAELDPDNAKGLFEYTVQGAMMAVSDDASAKAFLTSLDALLAKGAKDAALLEGMLANAARWSNGPLANKEAAVKYAKLLQAKAVDAAKHKKLLDEVLGDG